MDSNEDGCINCSGTMIPTSSRGGIVTYECEDQCGYSETRGFPKRKGKKSKNVKEKTIDEILEIDQNEEEDE